MPHIIRLTERLDRVIHDKMQITRGNANGTANAYVMIVVSGERGNNGAVINHILNQQTGIILDIRSNVTANNVLDVLFLKINQSPNIQGGMCPGALGNRANDLA